MLTRSYFGHLLSYNCCCCWIQPYCQNVADFADFVEFWHMLGLCQRNMGRNWADMVQFRSMTCFNVAVWGNIKFWGNFALFWGNLKP